MDSMSTWFARKLDAELTKVAEERINWLSSGAAQDYPQYRERVGYLQAIGDVRKIADEVASSFGKETR